MVFFLLLRWLSSFQEPDNSVPTSLQFLHFHSCSGLSSFHTLSLLGADLCHSHICLLYSTRGQAQKDLQNGTECGWSHTTFLAIPAILQASDGTHTSVKLSDTKAFRHDICSPIRTVIRLRNYGQAGLGIRANKAWLCHSTNFMSLDLWVNVSWFLFSSHRERRFYARAMHSPNLVHTFTKEKQFSKTLVIF